MHTGEAVHAFARRLDVSCCRGVGLGLVFTSSLGCQLFRGFGERKGGTGGAELLSTQIPIPRDELLEAKMRAREREISERWGGRGGGGGRHRF